MENRDSYLADVGGQSERLPKSERAAKRDKDYAELTAQENGQVAKIVWVHSSQQVGSLNYL